MAVALGLVKFYGSSIPRPRFYSDVKFSADRVDPPSSVMDPLLSWATDAHWSMGGLGYKRLRLQGRIEGNLKKLRKEMEQTEKRRSSSGFVTPIAVIGDDEPEFEDDLSDSAPPTPIVMKRKRRMAIQEEEEEAPSKRRLIRKLGDDFDLVADDAPLKEVGNISLRTRSRRSEVVDEIEEVKDLKKKKKKRKLVKMSEVSGSASPLVSASASPNGVRTSPRLSKLSTR